MFNIHVIEYWREESMTCFEPWSFFGQMYYSMLRVFIFKDQSVVFCVNPNSIFLSKSIKYWILANIFE